MCPQKNASICAFLHCMHAFMHACMRAGRQTCVHLFVHVHAICVHGRASIHACIHASMRASVRAGILRCKQFPKVVTRVCCVRVATHAYMCACIRSSLQACMCLRTSVLHVPCACISTPNKCTQFAILFCFLGRVCMHATVRLTLLPLPRLCRLMFFSRPECPGACSCHT